MNTNIYAPGRQTPPPKRRADHVLARRAALVLIAAQMFQMILWVLSGLPVSLQPNMLLLVMIVGSAFMIARAVPRLRFHSVVAMISWVAAWLCGAAAILGPTYGMKSAALNAGVDVGEWALVNTAAIATISLAVRALSSSPHSDAS